MKNNDIIVCNNRFFLCSLIIFFVVVFSVLHFHEMFFWLGAVTFGTRVRFISELFKSFDEGEAKKEYP